MNYHNPTGIRLIYIICLFASFSLKAQDSKTKAPLREPDYNKPKIFNSLPASMEVTDADLQSLVSPGTQKSSEISLPLAGGKLSPFTGKVAYAFSNDRMRTVTIQSTSFNGAVLTLSSVSKSDGTVRYTGRIFSYQHGDAFELQQKDDHYYWIKKNLHEMMAE